VTTPSTTRTDRYGPPPRRLGRRGRAITVAVALLAAVGWVAWVSLSGPTERVSWTDVGFTVVDDGTTRVTFDVNRSPGRLVVCTVHALNSRFAVVGDLDVTVAPADRRQTRTEATLSTSERAVSGTVKACAVQP
jgi:hypothetical protein